MPGTPESGLSASPSPSNLDPLGWESVTGNSTAAVTTVAGPRPPSPHPHVTSQSTADSFLGLTSHQQILFSSPTKTVLICSFVTSPRLYPGPQHRPLHPGPLPRSHLCALNPHSHLCSPRGHQSELCKNTWDGLPRSLKRWLPVCLRTPQLLTRPAGPRAPRHPAALVLSFSASQNPPRAPAWRPTSPSWGSRLPRQVLAQISPLQRRLYPTRPSLPRHPVCRALRLSSVSLCLFITQLFLP